MVNKLPQKLWTLKLKHCHNPFVNLAGHYDIFLTWI